jgi:hypothetical protein
MTGKYHLYVSFVISGQLHASVPSWFPHRAGTFQTWTVYVSFRFLRPKARRFEAALASCCTCNGHVMSCNYIGCNEIEHHVMDVITSHYMTITCHVMVKGRMKQSCNDHRSLT